MALIIFLVLLSALAFCKEITAHMAAGIHPKIVICKIKHKTPVSTLPLKKKESQGSSIAIKVIIQVLSD